MSENLVQLLLENPTPKELKNGIDAETTEAWHSLCCVAADEIETLKARYRSLLDKHLALFTKRQRAEQRLRDVVSVVLGQQELNGGSLAESEIEAIMAAARYVRCECGGSGWYVGATVADEYHNPMQEQIECPCVSDGTTGWVPVP